MTTPAAPAPRSRTWFVLQAILALMILIPAACGFGMKFRELVLLYQSYQKQSQSEAVVPGQPVNAAAATEHFTEGEVVDGGFAIVPILNYLLVSAGFFALFFAALLHGMFRDIEKPKRDLLRQEELLDLAEAEDLPLPLPRPSQGV